MGIATYSNGSVGVTDWRGSAERVIRIDGCLMCLCVAGMAVVSANKREMVFRRGDFLILTPDVYFSVTSVSSAFQVRYMSFSEEMMEMAYYKVPHVSLWKYLHDVPVLGLMPEQYRLLSGWFDQMEWIGRNMSDVQRVALCNSQIYTLFVSVDTELTRFLGDAATGRKNRAWGITCRFLSLLSKHVFYERGVGFYADALHITPGYLNKVCRLVYGMSPKAFIGQQLLVEMKTYLADTQLSVAEIAGRLHFEDASYMCRFFRRMCGCSPTEFRNGR